MMSSNLRILRRLACAAAVSALASAQTVVREHVAPTAELSFACELLGPGDLTGDGVPDYVIASCGVAVRAFSGADGALHTEIPAPAYGPNFGSRMAALGDVDGDGLGDYAIAQPSTLNVGGTVWVHSGATGALIRRYDGAPGDFLGAALGSAGDVDGDGVLDLAAHAFNWFVPGVEEEFVVVWSGATGDVLHRFGAPALSVVYGENVAGVGDVDADGLGDVGFGWRSGSSAGFEVRSGASGAVLFTLASPSDVRRWSRPAALGDVDGDGRDDFAVTTNLAGASGHKSLWTVSGTGALLSVVEDVGGATDAPAAIRDLDGDGIHDLVVGVPLAGSVRGLLTLRSGREGALLAAYVPPSTAHLFGADVAVLGDLDGDGRAEIIVGDAAGRGVARILSGAALGPMRRQCAAAPNSTGRPAYLTALGSLSVHDSDLALVASSLPAHTLCLFVRGAESADLSFGDGVLCVSPFAGGLVRLGVVAAGPGGVAVLAPPAGPASGVIVGSTWSFQALFRDAAGGPAGFNGTDGLRGTFTP